MVGLRPGVKANMQKNGGYTIVEVMIFLAVSTALLLSVMAAVSGQQQKTQFVTGVRDFETKIQDIVNDVETGYYPNDGSTRCEDAGAANSVDIQAVPDPGKQAQGTNTDCVFLGKAIAFSTVAGGSSAFTTTTIAGGRKQPSPDNDKEITGIDNARPTAFNKNNNGVETGELRNGIEMTGIKYWRSDLTQDAAPADNKYVGVVANIGTTTQASGMVTSITGRPRLVYMESADISSATINSTAMDKAGGGVAFCLRDGSSGRKAAVTLGLRTNGGSVQLTGQDFSTEVYFDNDANVFGCSG